MAYRRRSPLTTKQRGYSYQHQQLRKAALAALRDGDPCGRCGGPMYHAQTLHLDHDDHDRTRYRGLAHASCNERAAALKLAAIRRGQGQGRGQAQPGRPAQHNPSQAW